MGSASSFSSADFYHCKALPSDCVYCILTKVVGITVDEWQCNRFWHLIWYTPASSLPWLQFEAIVLLLLCGKWGAVPCTDHPRAIPLAHKGRIGKRTQICQLPRLASAANHPTIIKIHGTSKRPKSCSSQVHSNGGRSLLKSRYSTARKEDRQDTQRGFPHLMQGTKGFLVHPFPAIAEGTARKLQMSPHYVES